MMKTSKGKSDYLKGQIRDRLSEKLSMQGFFLVYLYLLME
jgi:hypothetical protein